MELPLRDPSEITLPDWIGESILSLAEIGAVACLACMETNPEGLKARIGTEEMATALMSLQKKGILDAEVNGSRVAFRLDLDRALHVENGPFCHGCDQPEGKCTCECDNDRHQNQS